MALTPQQFESYQSLQRIGNPRRPNTTVYDIVDLAHLGKGKGFLANQDIRRGTRIIGEEALFSIGNIPEDGLSDQNCRAIWNFTGVNGPHHVAFSDLHAPVENGQVTLLGRFKTNRFDMGEDRHGNDIQERLTIHATADIRQGDKILIDYQHHDCFKTRAERQRKLNRIYGFACTCHSCTPNVMHGVLSDGRRTGLARLQARIVRNHRAYGAGNRNRQRNDIGELIRQIPLEGNLYSQLTGIYRWLAIFCNEEWQAISRDAIEERKRLATDAMEAAKTNLDLEMICEGHDSPGVEEMLNWMVGTHCWGWE